LLQSKHTNTSKHQTTSRCCLAIVVDFLADIENKIKDLKEQADLLRGSIFQMMADMGESVVIYNGFTLRIKERKKYQFSKAILDMEDTLKQMKRQYYNNPFAEFTIEDYLEFRRSGKG
jgi:hypothetical protein